MKTDEDEAFEQIEQARGWRKRQIANEVEFTRGLDPYREMVRNQTIDEIARAIEKFKPAFGPDTVASFAIFVRGMKR
jgi:hypothetical protein